MKEQIHRAMELATQQNSEVYLSLGFHLESGGDSRFGRILGHIERVIEALEYVEQHDAMKDSIEYLTIAAAGKRFLQA
jgi:hypothetical protein